MDVLTLDAHAAGEAKLQRPSSQPAPQNHRARTAVRDTAEKNNNRFLGTKYTAQGTRRFPRCFLVYFVGRDAIATIFAVSEQVVGLH